MDNSIPCDIFHKPGFGGRFDNFVSRWSLAVPGLGWKSSLNQMRLRPSGSLRFSFIVQKGVSLIVQKDILFIVQKDVILIVQNMVLYFVQNNVCGIGNTMYNGWYNT